MSDLLDEAVLAVRDLPAAMQEDVARVMLALAGKEQSVVRLTAKQEVSLCESLAQSDRGEFASEADVRAIWAKHGL